MAKFGRQRRLTIKLNGGERTPTEESNTDRRPLERSVRRGLIFVQVSTDWRCAFVRWRRVGTKPTKPNDIGGATEKANGSQERRS